MEKVIESWKKSEIKDEKSQGRIPMEWPEDRDFKIILEKQMKSRDKFLRNLDPSSINKDQQEKLDHILKGLKSDKATLNKMIKNSFYDKYQRNEEMISNTKPPFIHKDGVDYSNELLGLQFKPPELGPMGKLMKWMFGTKEKKQKDKTK